MPRPYSMELREQVARAVGRGISRRTAAQLFDVSLGFVVKLMQRWNRDHTLAPKRLSAHLLSAHAPLVRALVTAEPRITIDELRQRLADEGIEVARASVGRFLVAIGLSYKARRSIRGSGSSRARPPVQQPDATAGAA